MGPDGAGGPPDGAAVLGMTVDAIEVADVGEDTPWGVYRAEEAVGRLAAGRYRVVVRWSMGGDAAVTKTWATEVAVAAGRESRIEVPRNLRPQK